MKGDSECGGPQETMLGPVSLKFFISDPEEVEQSEHFRTSDHVKPFQTGKCHAKRKGGRGKEGGSEHTLLRLIEREKEIYMLTRSNSHY